MLTSIVVVFLLCGAILYLWKKCFKKKNIAFNTFLHPILDDPDHMKNLDEEKLLTNSYHRSKIEDIKFDTIVIGSGISGLSCASILAQEGKRVIVLEQSDHLGGYTSSFKEQGYEWATGVHVISNGGKTDTFRLMWEKVSEKGIQFDEYKYGYDQVILSNGSTFTYNKKDKMEADLINRFPKYEKDIKKFIEECNQLYDESGITFVRSLNKYVRMLLVPILTHICGYNYFKYNSILYTDFLEKYFKGCEDLKKIFSAQSFYAGPYDLLPTSRMLILFAVLLRGGYYPKEKNMIPKKIARVIYKHRGKLFCNARVEKILMKGNEKIVCGVKLSNGENIFANEVISTCGIFNTYKCLGTKYIPKELETIKPSFSFFTIFLGLDCEFSKVGLPPSNVWIPVSGDTRTERKWLESDGMDFSLLPYLFLSNCNGAKYDSDNDIENNGNGNGKRKKKEKDNKHGIEVLFPINYSIFKKYEGTKVKQRGKSYMELKEQFVDKALKVVNKHYPKIKDHLNVCFSGSPLSTNHWHNWQYGEMYGVEESHKKLFEVNEKFIKNKIKNLYIGGMDSYNGGVIPSLMSAYFTTSAVLKKNLVFEFVDAYKFQRKREKLLGLRK